MGVIWIPNITPDVETGIGAWKDDEILRVLRDGVAKDGHFLVPLMPFGAYQYLSDDDARAVVAYLRTVPPYRQAKPRQENKLGFMTKLMFKTIGVQMHKPIAGVAMPDRANKHEYGHYLMRVAACGDCHSLTEKGPRPETDPMAFAGSEVPFEDPGLGKVYASNISGDAETGLGRYDAAAVKQALRNGTRLDGKRFAPPMSILMPHISGMTDDDIDALVAYMKTLPAAKRKQPERQLAEPMRAQLGS
jgi:mono/diheme cytochrome c family protein